MYTPDNWVVIKLDDGVDPHYRVLASWSRDYKIQHIRNWRETWSKYDQ